MQGDRIERAFIVVDESARIDLATQKKFVDEMYARFATNGADVMELETNFAIAANITVYVFKFTWYAPEQRKAKPEFTDPMWGALK